MFVTRVLWRGVMLIILLWSLKMLFFKDYYPILESRPTDSGQLYQKRSWASPQDFVRTGSEAKSAIPATDHRNITSALPAYLSCIAVICNREEYLNFRHIKGFRLLFFQNDFTHNMGRTLFWHITRKSIILHPQKRDFYQLNINRSLERASVLGK